MPLYLLNAEIAVQMANSNPIFFECVSLFGISLTILILFNRGDDHSISGLRGQARIFGVAERRPRSLTFLLRRLNGFLIARWRMTRHEYEGLQAVSVLRALLPSYARVSLPERRITARCAKARAA
jgi:hypothetical protein